MYWRQDVWGTQPWGLTDVNLQYSVLPPAPTLDDVLRGSSTRLARLTLTRDGVDVMELPAVTWQVTVSRQGDQRRQLTATLPAAPGLVPTGAGSVLHPASRHEVRAEMGVYDPRFGEHWGVVGVFPVSQTSLSVDAGGSSVRLACEDRASVVRNAAPTVPIAWDSGPIEDVLGDALAHLTPYIPARLYRTGLVIPAGVGGVPGCDWWKLCRDDIARAAGADLYVNAAGEIELRRVHDITALSPEWSWRVQDGDVMKLDRDIDGRVMPDGVIVPWGKGKYAAYTPPASVHTPSAVRRWVRHDGDPSLIGSESHALWVGSREWVRYGRGVERVTFDVPADYRVDAGDVAQLHAPDHGVRQVTAVDSFTLTAGSPSMTVQFAEWQVKS